MASPRLDHELVATALETALRTFMLAVLLLLLAIPLRPELTVRWLTIVAGMYAFAIPAWIVNRRGHTRLASLIAVVALWALITAAAVTAGGIGALAVNAFLVLVLAAGLLLGERAVIVAGGVSILTAVMLVVVETAGWMPWPSLQYTPVMRLLGLTLLIVMAAGLVNLATGTIGQALQRSRRNEELFRAVVEDQTEMIVRWKPDGTRTFVNRAYSDVFGGRPEDFVGSSFMPLVVEAHRDGIRQKIGSLTPEQPLATEIHESLAPDGDVRWQEWTDRGIFDADGRLVELQSTGRDITERKRADEALRESTERLRALSARVQSLREEEGQRIAREIHDELGGALTGLQWDLRSIDRALSTLDKPAELDRTRGRIGEMIGIIDSTIATVRRISADLRPALLDDVGLVAAIQWHVEQFQARTGILCRVDAASDAEDLVPDRANAVFRICQEILTNVLRHAAATRVDVRMRQEADTFVVEVQDNGRGITLDESRGRRSLGLLGMRERALLVGGDIVVRGAAGKGTTVIVRVPTLSASLDPRTV